MLLSMEILQVSDFLMCALVRVKEFCFDSNVVYLYFYNIFLRLQICFQEFLMRLYISIEVRSLREVIWPK